MGQKINPTGLRLGIIKGWESSWYGGKNFSEKIVEDHKIRNYIELGIPRGGISKVVIERTMKLLEITIHTARNVSSVKPLLWDRDKILYKRL